MGKEITGNSAAEKDRKLRLTLVAGWKKKVIAGLEKLKGKRKGVAKTIVANSAAALKNDKVNFFVFEDLEGFEVLDTGTIVFKPPPVMTGVFDGFTEGRVQISPLGEVIGLGFATQRAIILRRTKDLKRDGRAYKVNDEYLGLVCHELNHALNLTYTGSFPPPEFAALLPKAPGGWEDYKYFLYELRGNVVQELVDSKFDLDGKIDGEAFEREKLVVSFATTVGDRIYSDKNFRDWANFIVNGKDDSAPSGWFPEGKKAVREYWQTHFFTKGELSKFGNFTNSTS